MPRPLSAVSVLALSILAPLMGGCADLRSYTALEQPTNETLKASVGQKVWRMTKTRDLPNAFGKADLFGRTTHAGYTEMRFLGMEGNSVILVGFRDLDIHSNETTMSRTRFATFQTTGNTTTGTIVGGGGADVEVLPPYEAVIKHDLRETKVIRHSGVAITILAAEPYQLTYSLSK